MQCKKKKKKKFEPTYLLADTYSDVLRNQIHRSGALDCSVMKALFQQVIPFESTSMTRQKSLPVRGTEISVSGKLEDYRELKIHCITLIVVYDTKFTDFGLLYTAASIRPELPNI